MTTCESSSRARCMLRSIFSMKRPQTLRLASRKGAWMLGMLSPEEFRNPRRALRS
jgi:hypothetical protein